MRKLCSEGESVKRWRAWLFIVEMVFAWGELRYGDVNFEFSWNHSFHFRFRHHLPTACSHRPAVLRNTFPGCKRTIGMDHGLVVSTVKARHE